MATNKYIWDLKTNKLSEVQSTTNLDGYEPVRTLDGKVVFIKRITDIYGNALRKTEETLLNIAKQLSSRFGSELYRNPEMDLLCKEGYVKSITRGLRACHILLELNKGNDRSKETFDDMHEFLMQLTAEEELTIPCGSLSKAFCKTIKERYEDTKLSDVCAIYGINADALSSMDIGNVIRVFLKAFVVAGAGFVLARIISSDGITVAREGVNESVSAEYAELEVLRRISAVASKSGEQVEIISGQLNIVNWLNRNNHQPATHLEIRSEIMNWLTPLGFNARQMTEEENKAYRSEKKS